MATSQDERDVQTAYDQIADTYADHFRSTEPELPVDLAMIEHFVSQLRGPMRVLDAGCGAGRMMPILSRAGCRVEGVDLSPGMVRRARRDHGEFVSRVGSLTALPFADATFDGVFSWYSTIHSPDEDLPLIVGEAHRVLRAGGVLILAFQCGSGTNDVSENYRRHGHDIALQRYNRTTSQMRSWLAHAEFREIGRLVRRASGQERNSQAFVTARVR